MTRNTFELEVMDEVKDVILLLYSKVKCTMAADVVPILSRVDTPHVLLLHSPWCFGVDHRLSGDSCSYLTQIQAHARILQCVVVNVISCKISCCYLTVLCRNVRAAATLRPTTRLVLNYSFLARPNELHWVHGATQTKFKIPLLL